MYKEWYLKMIHFSSKSMIFIEIDRKWNQKSIEIDQIWSIFGSQNRSFSDRKRNLFGSQNESFSDRKRKSKIDQFWSNFDPKIKNRAGKENQKSKTGRKRKLKISSKKAKNRSKMIENRWFWSIFGPISSKIDQFRPEIDDFHRNRSKSIEIDGTGIAREARFLASLARGSITLPSFASLMSLP